MPLGVRRGQNIGLKFFLPYCDFVAAGGIRVSQTRLVFPMKPFNLRSKLIILKLVLKLHWSVIKDNAVQ